MAQQKRPVGCGKDENTLVIGATSTPHAEILEYAKPLFEAKGYKLQIEVFSKYQLSGYFFDQPERSFGKQPAQVFCKQLP